MPIIASDSGGNFTPAPEGLHEAVCCDVVDLGMVDTQYGAKHKVRIVWQLSPDAGTTADGTLLTASSRFNLTLHENGTLRPFLEAWRGKRFTAEELKGFDLERLIDACCQLQIIHEEKDGRTYANVKACVPFPKNSDRLFPLGYVRVKDREQTGAEPADNDAEIPF